MKTSFKHFFDSTIFKDFAIKHPIGNWLDNNKNDSEKWMDLEMLLTSLSLGEQSKYNFENFSNRNPGLQDLYDQFNTLKKVLISYLNTLDFSVNNEIRKSKAYSFIESHKDSDPMFINFNYTPTVLNILEDLNHHSFAGAKHVHIHGSLKGNDVVIGAGAYEKSKSEFVFLKKSSQAALNPFDILSNLLMTEKIFVFGHTMGQPDHSYFKSFFAHILSESQNKKEITIITKNDRSRKDIMDHLEILTDNRVQDLRVHHELKFEFNS